MELSLSSSTRELLYKVVVVGDPNVGKSSFIQRYVNKRFNLTSYKATVGVDFALKVEKWSDDVTIKLQLWDIAGQERFTSMTRVYYKDAHACIIMFDLTKKNTFNNVIKWKNDLDSKCTLHDGSFLPCILLANKSDLPHRDIEQEEIENLCKDHSFIGWTETSVKDGLMIQEAMRFLLDETVSRHSDLDKSVDFASKPRSNSTLQVAAVPQDNLKNEKNCSC